MAISRIQVVFAGLPGLPGVSNFYYQADTQGEAASAHAAVSLFMNDFSGNVRSEMSIQVSGEIACINEQTGDLIEYFAVTPTNYQGQIGNQDALPFASQALLHFGTAGVVHNRKVAGRVFLPGFTEFSSTAGAVSPTTITGLGAQANTQLVKANTSQVVWSRPFEGSPGNPPRVGSVWTVSSRRINPQWSVLRSRRP